MKEAILNGKKIKYHPGRLIVGLSSQISHTEAKRIISENGGVVESIHKPNIADVRVPPEETIGVLEKLRILDGIRFVDLDYVSTRSF